MTDLFYVFGIALTVAALAISFYGLRSERFPDSRAAYTGVLGLMVALVVASCAFAVALSREEAEHRSEEVAEFRAEQAEVQAEAEEAATPPPEGEPPPDAPEEEVQGEAPETLELTSPADGALVFEPDTLEARAGEVELNYTNPSPVPHNVAIESEGETIAQGATVSGGDAAAAIASLEPGEYIFYCSIPGHRESGMEGDLTVE
jgi:plastocyanin